ncbi:NADPH dehydrogenase NamA [Virgibacillus sp. SK37]|uniref:NADPH dehydrogenase NamA n=1 Tax=Virgibacillus sp. SK37 TaxID=403957 RepID=UPI0004D11A27|nr:NADPH dehydrogenase NamA [Virgibacillus sp. SK37]AIF43502.1 NADPH dehydrogenase [Virgibacillus sp. SK37]
MMTKLFSPINFKKITLKNRIVMSPMCMYSCFNEDGMITPFHTTHYVSRAMGQIGLVMTEAAAVLPEGRISPQDLGIWNDEHIAGLSYLNDQIHQAGSKSAIQLAHAGRKAQVDTPIYSASALAFDASYKKPQQMTWQNIREVVSAFRDAAIRAVKANFDIIEIHAAHGYLINQFLSPLTNKRTDNYGGSRENRYRLLKEIVTDIKEVWEGPIFVRLSTDEYHEEGNALADILYFSKMLKEQGVDLIDCSSGGVIPAKIHTYPGYQLKRCEIIKQEADIKTGAVGLITTGLHAEEILQNERADLVFIGRALLRNPYWAKKAADEIDYEIEAPQQYKRGWF